MTISSFRRTCVHEAGHGVMALLVGAVIESVSVVPHPGTRGRAIVDAPTAWGDVMCAAAGSVAECIEFGRDDSMLDPDRDLVHGLTGGVQYAEYQVMARWMLEIHWKAVLSLAEALSHRYILTGDDVREIVGALEPNVYERPG